LINQIKNKIASAWNVSNSLSAQRIGKSDQSSKCASL
jgi:hypothetical protein